MVRFENPVAFFLLLGVPILYFLRSIKIFSSISFPLTLGDWHGEYFEWQGTLHVFLSALSRLLGIIAYCAVVAAYARPVVHRQEKIYASHGADIIFVVDTSPSMAAQDMEGLRRIDAAKQAIHSLADENGGDSFGLVEMAKEAALIVPPTLDRTVFFSKIDELVVGELGDGSAIGMGLSCAVLHLEHSFAPRKAIVLMTDGENNAGSINPYTAAHLVKEKGISLYVLGIGTKGMVSLEYVDPLTGHIYSGSLESNYDSQTLAKIATEADGLFFSIESFHALEQAFRSLSQNEAVVQSYRMKNNDIQYYGVFLLIAAACFTVAWCVRRVLLQEFL